MPTVLTQPLFEPSRSLLFEGQSIFEFGVGVDVGWLSNRIDEEI